MKCHDKECRDCYGEPPPSPDPCLAYLGCPVLIEWQDSTAVSGWHAMDTGTPVTIRTVGILVVVDSGHLTTAAGISRSGRVHDQLIIPRRCIVSAWVLSETPVNQPE